MVVALSGHQQGRRAHRVEPAAFLVPGDALGRSLVDVRAVLDEDFRQVEAPDVARDPDWLDRGERVAGPRGKSPPGASPVSTADFLLPTRC